MGIRKLGYVGLNVTDVDAWTDLLGRTLGIGVAHAEFGGDEVVLAELDEFKYRMALYPPRWTRHESWAGSSIRRASSTGSPNG